MAIYTKEEQFKLIEESIFNLEKIDNQYEEVCLEAIRKDSRALEYIKEQTKEMCLDAVRKSPLLLRFVKNQTSEICLEAIRRNAEALCCVKQQTEELCLEAVRKQGYTLRFVKNQNAEICMMAFKNANVEDNILFKYVKQPASEDTYIGIIKQCPHLIKKVKNKTPLICLYAFLQDYNLLNLKYVKNELSKLDKNKDTIKNNIFCLEKYKHKYNDRRRDFSYFNMDSLEYVKDFLLKENINNTYILDDSIEEEFLEILKEIALSNNELIIVDTGNIKPIHNKLANKIITKEELDNGFF